MGYDGNIIIMLVGLWVKLSCVAEGLLCERLWWLVHSNIV